MTIPILPQLKPLPIKDRISVIYIEKGNLDVIEGRVQGTVYLINKNIISVIVETWHELHEL